MKRLGYLKSWTIIEQRSDLELPPGFDQHILASNDDHWYMFLAMFTSNFSSLSLTCTSAFRCFITYQLVESYGWIVSVDLNILHLRYIFCWKKISQSLLNIGYPNEILENCWQVGLNQPRLANPLPTSLYNIQWYQHRPQTVQVNQLSQIALSTNFAFGFFLHSILLYFQSILLYFQSKLLYFENMCTLKVYFV